MVWASGMQQLTTLTGSEQVVCTNSSGVETYASTNLLAGLDAPTLFGSSTASLLKEGNINVQTSSAGVSPGATGADNVVAVYTLPASAFDVAGRTLQIVAAGSFASNGHTKEIKIFAGCAAAVVGSTVSGGTAIADTGAVTTSGGGWQIMANVSKYGAAGSNTQIAIHSQAQVGAAVSALLAPQLLTMTESAAIIIAITANCTTTASDVVFNWLEVNAAN